MSELTQTLKELYKGNISDGEVELAKDNHIASIEVGSIGKLQVYQTPFISFCIGILILAIAICILRKYRK